MVDLRVQPRTHKVCAKCGISRPLSEYGKMARHEHKLSRTCRPCIVKRQTEWTIRRIAAFDPSAIDMAALHRCAKCETEKAATDFFIQADRKSGISRLCVECAREKDRNRYRSDLQKRREQAKWGAVKKKFGLTREQWMEKYKSQNGLCSICSEVMANHPTLRREKRGACVDHNHRNGKVRDLLCNRCNQGLGLFRDNAVFLESAAAYLRRHE